MYVIKFIILKYKSKTMNSILVKFSSVHTKELYFLEYFDKNEIPLSTFIFKPQFKYFSYWIQELKKFWIALSFRYKDGKIFKFIKIE